jgi:NADPH:quinone reductase
VRAVIVRKPGPFRSHKVEEVPDPVPGPGEVVIEARAIGVNYPDLLVAEGKYQFIPPAPYSPGKEVAGIVATHSRDSAAEDSSLKRGDRVMAQVEYGAYAEKVVARAVDCHRMPDAMPFEHAVALGLACQTAWFALVERAQVRPGESVLVTGASGGVGLAAVQLAKRLGATVLAGVTSAQKGDLCRRHGADHIIDLSAANLRESIREQVFAASGRRGVDVVIDSVGGDAFDGALRALAWRGRLVVVGFAAGRIPEIKANYLLLKNIAVLGLQWSDYRNRDPGLVAQAQSAIFGFYLEKNLRPEITATYPLEQFADALARFEARQVQGKMLLVPGV